MVDPELMRSIGRRVDVLRQRNADRDGRMLQVRAVRVGNLTDSMFGDLFPREWPKPIVANVVDTAARDLAEMTAPLPTFSAASLNLSPADQKRADKRTRIVNGYLAAAKVQAQAYTGADQYVTYGFLPIRVEPDYKRQRPHMTLENPLGAYPEFDRWGNCTAYFRRMDKSVDELCALFPEYENLIRGSGGLARNGSAKLELVRWVDDERELLFLPQRDHLVLRSTVNPLGRCPVVVARRPSFDEETRGQFDDVLWIQMARAKFALLSLEAAHKAVEAPLAIPADVQHLPLGGDSVIRSREPEKIRRVPIEVPQSAFAQAAQLESEVRVGARYPEGRSGNIDASIVTGRGVQALMGGWESQVKTAQEMLGAAFAEAASMMLEMDEKLWPSVERHIRGSENGDPYEIKYRPDRDIKGEYAVETAYGVMAGSDPSRALVWYLQARGDKLVSRQFGRRNLPVALNVAEEERAIDVEEYRDALGQGVAALAASIPAMVQQGMDPAAAVQQIATVIEKRGKGESIEDAVLAAFAPPPPVEQPAGEGAPTDPADPMSAGLGGAPGGSTGAGLMPGVAPGQAAMGPGGKPDVLQLMASLRGNGSPGLSASVQRRVPI